MNRRNAIKNIGIGAGLTVSAGTLASLFSACNTDPLETWTPQYFTRSDANILEELSDILLPKTDTPSAKEAKVVRYMDMIVSNLYKIKDQKKFDLGFQNFKNKLKAEQKVKVEIVEQKSDKEGEPPTKIEIITASRKQLEAMLQKYMGSVTEEKMTEITSLLEGDAPDPAAENAAEEPYYFYNFMSSLRSLSISGYFGSELIGENHLAYAPMPGPYQGCIPLSETDGKVWAL